LFVKFLSRKEKLRGVNTIPKRYTFEDADVRINEVREAMKDTKDKRMYERYQCIYLLLSGVTLQKIPKILNRGSNTIGNYVKKYCTSGLSGLDMKRPFGRPPRLTPQEQEVHHVVTEKTPADVGFPSEMNWTGPLVRTNLTSSIKTGEYIGSCIALVSVIPVQPTRLLKQTRKNRKHFGRVSKR